MVGVIFSLMARLVHRQKPAKGSGAGDPQLVAAPDPLAGQFLLEGVPGHLEQCLSMEKRTKTSAEMPAPPR